jgi:RimJ/RimL family protein N-acetyltransferase
MSLPPLHVRPVVPGDRARLEAALRALGPETRQRRFGRVTVPADEALRWLDELDGRGRFALGACHAVTGEALAVARYVRAPRSATTAEIAVTVVDAWQGRRIGTLLARRLAAHARECGIDELLAEIGADNVRAIRLMRGLGAPRAAAHWGVVEMRAIV